jgi:phosphate starvation-inducible protein PhoH
MIDYFEDFLGKATTEIHLKQKTIEICSLETIRGRSWENTIIIVDESQSLFVPEVQALVTRIGEGSQMIFCGDNSGTQTDVRIGMDGLTYLEQLASRYGIEDTAFIKFTRDDIVRSGITKEFVIAFEEELQRDDPVVSLTDVEKQFKKGR